LPVSAQLSLFGEPSYDLLAGPALRLAREQAGLSVRALARLAGVDAMTVLRIESRGQGGSAATLSRLAVALGRDERTLALARACATKDSTEERRDLTPFADDDVAWYYVACHPDGLTLEQTAQALELSETVVQDAYQSALSKLRELAENGGTEGLGWAELLGGRCAHRAT